MKQSQEAITVMVAGVVVVVEIAQVEVVGDLVGEEVAGDLVGEVDGVTEVEAEVAEVVAGVAVAHQTGKAWVQLVLVYTEMNAVFFYFDNVNGVSLFQGRRRPSAMIRDDGFWAGV